MSLSSLPPKKSLLLGSAVGLALLLALGFLWWWPQAPTPILSPLDTLAAAVADSTAPTRLPPEAAFFPVGSPGLTTARLIARQRYQNAHQLLDSLDKKPHSPREQQGFDLQRAYCAQAQGDYPAALVALRRLQDPPPDLETHRLFWLARSLEETGDLQRASSQYEALLAAGQHPALLGQAQLRLAELCLKQGQRPHALELYTAALTGPQAPAALARLAQIDENPQTARQHRLQLWRQYPTHALALETAGQAPSSASAEETYARALVYFANQRYGQAGPLLEGLLAANPKPPLRTEARLLLGRVRGGQGQWEEARGIFARLWEKDHCPAARYHLAVALAKLDRDPEALRQYRLFVESFPKDELAPEALWQAGRIAERNDQFELAARCYQQLADQYPGNAYRDEARWRSGFMAYCRGEDTSALEIFAALGSQATDAQLADQGLFWAGKAAQRLGRTAEAQRCFQLAADHFPRSYYATRAVGLGFSPAVVAGADSSALPEPLHTRRAHLLLELGLLDLAQAELPDSGRLELAELSALKAIRDRCEELELRNRGLRLSSRIVSQDYGPQELRHAYPRYYFDRIRTAATEAQIDPCLVLSVMRQESFFDSGAVSPVGALGLMQIMPETGKTLARQLGVSPFGRERLFEPQVSIRMGSHYLGEQLRAFQAGPAPELAYELSLAAYNAGPEAAKRWLGRYPHADLDIFVERVPYKETRLYIKKVMRNLAIYKTLTQV